MVATALTKCVVDRLGVAEADEAVAKAVPAVVLRILAAVHAAQRRQRRGNDVQPGLPPDLFEEILAPRLARRQAVVAGLEVDLPPRGHRAFPEALAGLVRRETETGENALDFGVGDGGAAEALQLGAGEAPGHPLRRGRDDIDAGSFDRSAGELDDERRTAPRSLVAGREVGATFETVRRVGVHAETLGADARAPAIEVGGLEQNVGGAGGHFGVEAAHDPGQTDDARAVGDDEHLRIELALLAVERRQLLPGARPPHHELAARDGRKIVGVERLSRLPEAEVRRIDDVVDRPRTDRLEPPHQPLRRGTDLHAADDPQGEARTAFGVVDLDRRLWTVRREALSK